jgi:hypothetical protein
MNIAEITENIKELLMNEADELGRRSRFIKRERKFSGRSYAQMLVFGSMGEPELSYTDMVQYAKLAGTEVSAQGVAARFTEEGAQFLAALLEKAVHRVVESRASEMIPILNKFTGVYLRDSSVINLPAHLKKAWPGVGGSGGETAALKLQVRLNYKTGELDGPALQPARMHDRRTPYQYTAEPAGSLSLADLGYFNLDEFQARIRAKQYVITRYKHGTILYHEDGTRLDLLTELRQLDAHAEMAVRVGRQHRLPMRLLVEKVPTEVAQQRRRKLREYARKKQTTVRPETLELTNWIVILTNVPAEMLAFDAVKSLLYLRWQVELLFKLWKSYFRIDEWRSDNPWRILCELYAKLITVVICQWIFQLDWWRYPDRSLVKAAQVIQKFAPALASSLTNQRFFLRSLHKICACIRASAHVNKRANKPATYQTLLLSQSLGGLS